MGLRSVRVAYAATIVAAVLALAFASDAYAAPSLGLAYSGSQNVEGHGEASISPEEWAVLGKSGLSIFRFPFEPRETANGMDWSYYDTLYHLAAERNVTVLPMVGGRMTGGVGVPNSAELPEWLAWLKKGVQRYGLNGSFWTTHPEIPYKPITAWEITNEPNASESFVPAGEYGELLANASTTIQSASKEQAGVTTGVLFGGLLIWNGATGYQSYLEAAVGKSGTSAFTGVAIHPYEIGVSNPAGKAAEVVSNVRNFLNAHSMSGKSIWITEFGIPAEGVDALPSQGAAQFERESAQVEALKGFFNWSKESAEAKSIKAVIWFNSHDSDIGGPWQFRCGLRDEVGNFRRAWYAFQEETGAARWPVPVTAFQANTESLWIRTRSGGGTNTLWGMAKGTSPSIGQYKGSYEVAFQANTGTLWTHTPAGGTNTGQKVAPGTSPSISALGGGTIAYQSSSGNLSYIEGGTIVNTSYGMAPGTSPSVTEIPARFWRHPTRYAIAFQSSAGQLWFLEPGGAVVNTGLGMASGTSPGIAAIDTGTASNRFAIAFQANSGQLWFYEPGGVQATTGFGMAPGTSPGITALSASSGKFTIAFQANTNVLWTHTPGGATVDTGLGMQSSTNPGITGIGDLPYLREVEVALNTTSGSLWTYEPGGAITNTLYGYQPGTSPSIGQG